jgi:DNA-binding HxlR family transcriptional regulator
MTSGYGQFCPVAKGAEIFATRWTPLVLRELMSGERSFNDIHRGVPLMSRALLAERLRQLESDGIIAKVSRRGGSGHDYRLTHAGDALRPVVEVLGRWGLLFGRDRLHPDENDPTVLLWALRRRVDRQALPARRVVVQFDFSGVPGSRTGVRSFWLVLERENIDVCSKDPGFSVDATVTCEFSTLVHVYLGYLTWRTAMRRGMRVEGSREVTGRLEAWLQLDRVVGRDLPIVPPS